MGLNAYFTYNVVGYYGTGNVRAPFTYINMRSFTTFASVMVLAASTALPMAILCLTISLCCRDSQIPALSQAASS